MIKFGPNKSPEDVVGYLRDVNKQVQYAGVRTANNIALKIQRFTLDTLLPEKFTLRAKGAPWQRPGMKTGFNIKFATKDTPQAKIGSQADWLQRQEFGGEKTASNGGRVAIPSSYWKPKPELMQRFKKPRALLDMIQTAIASESAAALSPGNKRAAGKAQRRRSKLTSFLAQFGLFGIFKASMNGHEGIYARTGKDKYPIKELFLFEDHVAMKPLLEFEKSGMAIVDQSIEPTFQIEFAKAMATAK